MKLLIDDIRAYSNVMVDVIARRADLGIEIMTRFYKRTDFLYLDHDLGDEFEFVFDNELYKNNGYSVLLFLERPENEEHRPKTIELVTSNPPARAKMASALTNIGYVLIDGRWNYKN